MFGWHGRVLRVDLSSGQVSEEDIDPQIARDFIGGRGWAIKYLHDEVDPAVDPLSPQNKLIFAAGPLTDTPAPRGTATWCAPRRRLPVLSRSRTLAACTRRR